MFFAVNFEFSPYSQLIHSSQHKDYRILGNKVSSFFEATLRDHSSLVQLGLVFVLWITLRIFNKRTGHYEFFVDIWQNGEFAKSMAGWETTAVSPIQCNPNPACAHVFSVHTVVVCIVFCAIPFQCVLAVALSLCQISANFLMSTMLF